MTIKRRNRISEQFSAHVVSMLESPAFMVLSLSARRVMARLEIELAHHGGNDNGKLPVTYEDFVRYGIDRDSIAPAIREAEALGFIKVTERGRGGNAEFRQPNKFLLTYMHARTQNSPMPTHDWRMHKTVEEAEKAARAARENKDRLAVRYGRRRAANRKNQSGGPRPEPVGKTPTETKIPPVGKTPITASVGKSGRLSISRGGGAGSDPVSSPCLSPRKIIPIPGYGREAQRANQTGAQASEAPASEDDLTIPDFLRRPCTKQAASDQELDAFDRNNMEPNEGSSCRQIDIA